MSAANTGPCWTIFLPPDPATVADLRAERCRRLPSDHQKLAAAILGLAVDHMTRRPSRSERHGPDYYRAAVVKWMDAGVAEQEGYVFSFVHCCQALALDPVRVRRQLVGRDAATWQPKLSRRTVGRRKAQAVG